MQMNDLHSINGSPDYTTDHRRDRSVDLFKLWVLTYCLVIKDNNLFRPTMTDKSGSGCLKFLYDKLKSTVKALYSVNNYKNVIVFKLSSGFMYRKKLVNQAESAGKKSEGNQPVANRLE